MELFLHQNGEQVGPYTEEQLAAMVASGAISRGDIVWREGLADWQPIHTVINLPAPLAPKAPSPAYIPQQQIAPNEVTTNVKQGAIIGGWVCLGLGLIFMVWSLLFFVLYGPLYLAAFILSIAAMSQRRILGGVSLLVATLVVPSVLGLILFASRTTKFAKEVSESMKQPTAAEIVANGGNADTQTATGDKPPSMAVSFADQMKKGMAEAQLKSDLKMLEELRARKLLYDKKLIALREFRILHANFSKDKDAIGMTKPIIELTIQNETGFPVKRASFRGVLSSPGRAIPWIDDTFSYEISGGMESGEKDTWRLAPNMFGEWGKVDAVAGARFDVTVTGLEGADGKELFGDVRFGEYDEKKLLELEEKCKSEQE
jgi:hypothetical protein